MAVVRWRRRHRRDDVGDRDLRLTPPEGGGGRACRRDRRPRGRAAPDGGTPQRAHAAAGEPGGRLRLPGLRLAGAGGRAPVARRVLRERRQGGRRGGDAAPGRPPTSSPPTRSASWPTRSGPLARPAGPARPSRWSSAPGPTTTSRSRWDGAFALIADAAARAGLARRGGLLHLRPYLQRGRLLLAAAGPGVRHQQPARLLQHVPRVVRAGADPDDRRRQGQRHPRRHPRGEAARRRRPEPRHQPPPDAHRAGEGQARRRHDRRGQPAARGRA